MKKTILKFSEFKVLETSEFNFQRMNSDSVQASTHVDNPQLSLNAFDKHQDALRQTMTRIGDIMHSVKGTNAYKSLRSKLALEDQDITNMRILRILKSNLIYDVYLTFIIGEDTYWGKVSNIIGLDPKFTSEVFDDTNLYQPKEWVIKTSGLVIKTIKTWLKPEPGTYKVIKDEINCYSVETGKLLKMEEGLEVELVRSHNDRIIIRYDSETYNLVGDNYIYFNWWLLKIE